MKTIAIAGTFDSKGTEYAFVKDLIERLGFNVFSLHVGVFEPLFEPDVSNEEVAAAVGEDIQQLAEENDRGKSMDILSRGLEQLLTQYYREGKFDAVLALGGSGGTSLVTPAMRALPIGVPKVMVSTMASGNVSQYVGTSDIVMMPSVVDVAGLNSISTKIFTNGVFATIGMISHERDVEDNHKPLVAASMFGVTTPCIDEAKAYLEAHGYEVLVFHATGTGGKTMEALIEGGFIKGVLDITTTEWCDEVVGGVLSAGPNRLEAASLKEVPQVVSVGALDMVNYGPYETVPEAYLERNLYKHNPTVTLMRTNADEMRIIGGKIAEKLNLAKKNTALFLPLKGVSSIDVEGMPFYGPEEDQVLFDVLRTQVNQEVVEIIEMDCDINAKEFAIEAAKKLIEMM